MIKTKSLLILIFSLLFSNYYLSFSQELTITTYYPSPVGIYKELRAKRMAIGDSFYDPSHYCWEGSCTVSVDSDADLIVEGKVGIGTNDPEKELHVAGDTKVENNLNVDGGVVIGNPTGGNKGAGTINAEKIYVDGSEIGKLLQTCGWFEDKCPDGWVNEKSPSTKTKSETVYYNYLGTVYTYYIYCKCKGYYGCVKSDCSGYDSGSAHAGCGACCAYQYGAGASKKVEDYCCRWKGGECEDGGDKCECYEYSRHFLWCCPPK